MNAASAIPAAADRPGAKGQHKGKRQTKPSPSLLPPEDGRLQITPGPADREAGEPVAVGVIAVRALARKGCALPTPGERRYVRGKVRATLLALERRGVTRKVGRGRGTKRLLSS